MRQALFLGYGRMGAALGEAWLRAGLLAGIDAVDPGRDGAGLRARLFRAANDLPDQAYDLVVLAVKPAMAQQALRAVPPARLARACLVSIMAGVPAAALRQASQPSRPVARAMPNTPVMAGRGCTGLYGGDDIGPGQRAAIGRLFEAVGAAFWVDTEDQLHAVTALSGSGPAYYHLFSEALAQAGEQLGLPAALARSLAARTALGAASLQCEEGADFAALRREVTSPQGTTHAAIEVFEQAGALRTLVRDAVRRAQARSRELARP